MLQCFMGGDYYSILSTAEVTSGVLYHTSVIIVQKLDRFLRKTPKGGKQDHCRRIERNGFAQFKKRKSENITEKYNL